MVGTGSSLTKNALFDESKELARELLRVVRRAPGTDPRTRANVSCGLANALYLDPVSSRADVAEAVALAAAALKIERGALGPEHPRVVGLTDALAKMREDLAAREA